MQKEYTNIQILYTEAQQDIADSICHFLEEKLAKSRAPQTTAVILVSDEATMDETWQKAVRSLSERVRLIPVGGIVNVDYNDPNVIPPKIEELNFIRIDPDMNDNILDSILIDQDFYDVRNNILINMNAWLVSDKADAFLMSHYRRVKKTLRMIRTRIANESDERFLKQLQDMESYLQASKPYARKIFFRTLRNRLSVTFLTLFSCALAVAAYFILSNLQRAARESALLGKDTNEATVAEDFVLLSDGVNNVAIDGTTRGALFNQMMTCLDVNWTTTPTGYNYKYRLYDPHLSENERYLMTTTENRHVLIWDTWTGKIEEDLQSSQSDLLAYAVDQENGYVIAVDEEKHILFGDSNTNDWLTNNVEYPFTGNSDIHILTIKGTIVIYDDQNKFTFITEPSIRLASYVTTDTMGTDDYTIHAVSLSDHGETTAMEVRRSMSMYYTEGSQTPGLSTNVKSKEDCQATVNDRYMVFADEHNNVYVLDKETRQYDTVGIQATDIRYLAFVNETTFAYNDYNLGTHLYDLKRQIDLGEVLVGFKDLEYLGASENTVFCYADGAYHCQSITAVLPKETIDESEVIQRYTGLSPTDEGLLSNVTYKDHQVFFDLTVYTSATTATQIPYVFDGSHYRATGIAISDQYVKEEGTYSFRREPLTYHGEVTVLGIIDDGFGLIICTDDGRFRELSFNYNGTYYMDAYAEIPGNAAIVEIVETDSCYYLKDAAGNYWQVRKGYPSHTDGSWTIHQMNERLKTHGYFTEDIIKSISKQTIEDMGIGVMPGGDGKEWE